MKKLNPRSADIWGKVDLVMSYVAEISRVNPSCFLFLVDQSGSMADPWGRDTQKRKCDAVADAMNRMLSNLVIKCTKSEGVRDYFHVGIIGYGGRVGPALEGATTATQLVPISKIANAPVRVEERSQKVPDGAGGLVEQRVKFPIWFDPVANGGTPMCEALGLAHQVCEGWISEHASGFPPTVLNITDGEATDGDPSPQADRLRSLATVDGNALLYNAHISSNPAVPVEYPDGEEGLADQFARLLFRMSSTLPPHVASAARQEGLTVSDAARGFVFNADMVTLIRFLDIGTRPSQLR